MAISKLRSTWFSRTAARTAWLSAWGIVVCGVVWAGEDAAPRASRTKSNATIPTRSTTDPWSPAEGSSGTNAPWGVNESEALRFHSWANPPSDDLGSPCTQSSCGDLGCTQSSCTQPSCTQSGCMCGGGVGVFGCLLGTLLHPSDHCFDDFISPITNPIFFEDPRTLTEIRPIFVHHKIPLAAGGGSVNVMAPQIRLALSDDISLIATKAGFMTSENPIVNDGWLDLALGLKFNLLKDAVRQRIFSAGLVYELPVGTPQTLQGNGEGEFNIFFTGAQRIGARGQWISATGFRLPANTTDESQVWYWSNHFGRRLVGPIFGLIEFNWFHWLRSGVDGPVVGLEGFDVFNLGAPDVAGNDIVTGAFGFKYKPHRHLETGVAWEVPLTERRDIIDNRLTFSTWLRY